VISCFKQKNKVSMSKADDVFSVTCLFGKDLFFETQNSGIISNIINNVLIVLSINLVEGCQGGGVFEKKKGHLLAIVVASSFYLRNDNISLTLAVSLDEIIIEVLKFYVKMEPVFDKRIPMSLNKGEKCVALIDNGTSWGCGTFVNVLKKKFLLSCSHIFDQQATSQINVLWYHGSYKANAIYLNKFCDKAYDIALLSVGCDIPEDCCAELSKNRPIIGSKVFNVGFPLMYNLAKNPFSPFIYNGTITNYSTGLLCTDSYIQCGQSGGPMFDQNWNLIGICISNTKTEVDQTIFPFVNMCVPIFDILKVLETFSTSNDVLSLKSDLLAPSEVQRKWNLESPIFSSRL